MNSPLISLQAALSQLALHHLHVFILFPCSCPLSDSRIVPLPLYPISPAALLGFGRKI